MKTFAALKMILTIRCDDASRLASDGLDRDLSFAERLALRLHKLICPPCRRFARQIRAMHERFQTLSKQARRELSQSAGPQFSQQQREHMKKTLAQAKHLDSN